MSFGRSAWIIGVCLLGIAVPGVFAADPELIQDDVAFLRAAHVPTDGPGLVTFFQRRSQPAPSQAHFQRLILSLGKTKDAEWQSAAAELIGYGPAAIPYLRAAAKDLDQGPRAARAQQCLTAIGQPSIPATAARLLAARNPGEGAAALLAFLPYADNELVEEAVEGAIEVLALPRGQPAPAVLAALRDESPIRRAAVAALLCKAGGRGQVPAVRPLLQDPRAMVRLRAALALGELDQAEAVPVLIDLLGELAPTRARPVEEFLTRLAGEAAPVDATTKNWTPLARREAWSLWWHGIQGEQLLDAYRQHTLADGEREQIQKLIRQLGDEDFTVRQEATTALQGRGPRALPFLQEASRSKDAEIAHRAQECLKTLTVHAAAAPPLPTPRLVAVCRPPGAAAVLLAYLPSARDAAGREAIQEALNSLARSQDSTTEQALKTALNDKAPLRRQAAAIALCQAAGRASPAVQRLLKDSDALVRLSVARALAQLGDPESIPALIQLLGDLPDERRPEAEEILVRLAGAAAPEMTGTDERSRRQAMQAWLSWWQKQGNQLDWSRLKETSQPRGHLLLARVDNATGGGVVYEIDREGRVRWEITGLRYPTDAQELPGRRVLITEYLGQRVSLRDERGRVLWEYPVTVPVNCQRLAGGHTFIAGRGNLLELDRHGKEVYRILRPRHDLVAAAKLPDGQIVCLTSLGTCQRLDSTGRVLHEFPVAASTWGALDTLPGGRILVPENMRNRVVEYDREGRVLWEASVQRPSSAQRLPNGNTLVAAQFPPRLIELDRNGQTVAEQALPAPVWRARRQ